MIFSIIEIRRYSENSNEYLFNSIAGMSSTFLISFLDSKRTGRIFTSRCVSLQGGFVLLLLVFYIPDPK